MSTDDVWVKSRMASFPWAFHELYQWWLVNQRMPTMDDLQGEPFNYTEEYAREFIAWCIASGRITDDEKGGTAG